MDSSPFLVIPADIALSSLKLLFDIYAFRRKSAPEKQSQQASPSNTTTTDAQPNPEQLQELIKEFEQNPTTDAQALSTAIEEKFPPQQAAQVKNDLTALSALSNPPNFADYDYYGLFSQYTRALSTIATSTELFRLRGTKTQAGRRLLPMRETAKVILPADASKYAVSKYGDIATASLKAAEVFLTDAASETPALAVLKAEFIHASSVGYGEGEHHRKAQVYWIQQGQDTNWFRFAFPDSSYEPGFNEFSYRLSAADAKAIIGALKQDISAYLREVEEEKPVVKELADELRPARSNARQHGPCHGGCDAKRLQPHLVGRTSGSCEFSRRQRLAGVYIGPAACPDNVNPFV